MKDSQLTSSGRTQLPWLEKVLSCVVLGLTVLRLTIIETPLIESPQSRLMLDSENISLLLSTCILLCALVWLLAVVLTGRLYWRRTWFGSAVGLFIVAGIIAACFASNKRAAVTDLTLLTAPMITGMMLVQWLRSAAVIRLALLLIISVGVAAATFCYIQFSFLNEDTIKNYKENPTAFLAKQGIEPGGLEHWMYEHRLYSNNINGFLMTSNSNASFFLLTVFAGVGLCAVAFREFLKPVAWKDREHILVAFICCFLALVYILTGLLLTRSKGGIGAFVLSSLTLTVLLGFGKTIWRWQRIFGIMLLLLIVVTAGCIVHYGTTHGRLPGGNSMLVRWQYWVSAAEMIYDHALTGVGGGNFPEFYTHYKIPAALETVQSPHNWILSLLSQYGPLGLLAVAVMMLTVFFKGLKHACAGDDEVLTAPQSQPAGRLWMAGLIFSAMLLLILRPVLVDLDFFYQKPDVAAAAYLFLYLIPALVFVLAFILLWKTSSVIGIEYNNRQLSIALMCGLVAVLIHNLVDFAVFEPGNWSLFWLFAAIIIAQIHNTQKRASSETIVDVPKRLGLGAGLILLSIAYLAVVLLPPLRAELMFKKAMDPKIGGKAFIEQAIAADALSPKTAYQAANLLTQLYQNTTAKEVKLLEPIESFADTAIDRNPADFKPWRLKAKLNVIHSERTEGQQKQAALEKAFENLQQAVARYPGSGKLHFLLGNVAEQLGRDEIALCHYQTAVDIEDTYRAQFKIMYPERKTIISRLGEDAYTEAKAKIQALQKHTP